MPTLPKSTVLKRPTLFTLLILSAFLVSGSALLTGCSSNKTGCPINEQAAKSNVDKQGNLKTKRGKSNLFPKKMR
jgi:hypothetical protein